MAESNNKINLRIDLRVIVGLLVAIIIGMLLAWMPWQTPENSSETIKVTGEAVVKAEPDQFVFYPSYQFKNADKTAAIDAASDKSESVITKLKELGVAESKIKSDINGYLGQSRIDSQSEEYVYTLQLTITLDNKDMAQSIQDYLVTTQPQSNVTPQGSFSDAKRKELESKARDEATKDARTKADQSAKNLGFKLGRVKAVEDGVGFGGVIPLMEGRGVAQDSSAKSPVSGSITVQPGENELRYSVSVTYFVR